MRKLFGSVCIAAIMATSAVFAEPNGTFRQAHELGFGANSDLDPASRGRVFQITEKIFSRLVRPGEGGRPAPDLATAWSANADATVWTLTLREGVTFHDGSAFDADDVVYTLNRILDPATDSPVRSAIRMITSVEAVSPTEVRLSLDTPFADLPLQLMDYRLRMIPEGSGDTIAQTGIGTGPFRLVSFDSHGITRLEANMDYFLGAPGVAQMEIIGIADAQARLQALLGGQIDTERVTAQQLPMFQNNPRLRVDEVATGNWRGIVFRTDVEPFNDPRVRMALRLAADREELVQLVLGGFGVVSCDSPVGPSDQYRAEMTCPQDTDSARALLVEAGFPDGIDLDVYVSTIESTWPAMVEAYQAQAAEAGIRVNIVQVPSDGFWSEVWMRRDAVVTRWNDRPADQVLHEVYLGGTQWNESFYNDPDFDALLAAARREQDYDARRALYVQAQEHLWETTGTLIPYHVTIHIGSSSRVQNLDAVEAHAVRWHLVTVTD